jgi:hypothetical protein
MKTEPETSSEYGKFKNLLNHILSVSREEIAKRETEYKRQSALNPNRPGPKPKSKQKRASRVPAV